MINVKNVSKSYKIYNRPIDRMKEALSISRKKYHNDFWALKDINFNVKSGENIGIIGTNGSGKSTLLKIITGVLTPTDGTIKVNGRISALLELGAGFNPEYTGVENIYLNGTMMGYSKEEIYEKMNFILDFADIGDFAYQPVKNYSSGMFARLAFAVAINVEPDVLIVDEALSVGDVFFQNKCYRKFEELKNRGTTIIFVSHDLETVKNLCTRVLWIERGIQKMYGDAIDVCNQYSRQFLLKNNEVVVGINRNNNEFYNINLKKIDKLPEVRFSNESLLNEKVKIEHCVIFDDRDNICYNLIGGNEYNIVIVFKTEIELKDCIVGYVIQNKRGVAIINNNSLISGDKSVFIANTNSKYYVNFRFKLPFLAPDEYIIDCAVATGTTVEESVMQTWLYGAMKFTVSIEERCLALMTVDTKIEIFKLSNN